MNVEIAKCKHLVLLTKWKPMHYQSKTVSASNLRHACTLRRAKHGWRECQKHTCQLSKIFEGYLRLLEDLECTEVKTLHITYMMLRMYKKSKGFPPNDTIKNKRPKFTGSKQSTIKQLKKVRYKKN